jgi:hypothetical protein
VRNGARIGVWIIGILAVVTGLVLLYVGIARRATQSEVTIAPPSSQVSGGTQAETPSSPPREKLMPQIPDSFAARLTTPMVIPPLESTMDEARAGRADSMMGLVSVLPSGRFDSTRARGEGSISLPGPGDGTPFMPGVRSAGMPAPTLALPDSALIRRAQAEPQRADTAAAEGNGTRPASPAWPDTFFIHVSSYQQPAQAAAEVQRLHGLGIDARFASVVLPARGVWYRVVVGAFPDSMTAWREASRLREIGYIAFAQILRGGGRQGTR